MGGHGCLIVFLRPRVAELPRRFFSVASQEACRVSNPGRGLGQEAKPRVPPGGGSGLVAKSKATGGILYGQRVAGSVLTAPQVGCDAAQAVLPHLCI